MKLRTDIKREFDPGSGRTLAACLTHASRARFAASPSIKVNLVLGEVVNLAADG